MTIIFVILSGAFAAVHLFAMKTSMYWYYPWFDIVMHFWGGVLLALGVHSFSSFSRIYIKPSLPVVLIVVLMAATTWEIFERLAGLYDPATYVFDTAKDLIIGLSGGLLAHLLIRKYTIG